jgi:hypothetical protein
VYLGSLGSLFSLIEIPGPLYNFRMVLAMLIIGVTGFSGIGFKGKVIVKK